MFLVKKSLQKDFFVSIYFQENNFFGTHKEQDLVIIFTISNFINGFYF